VAVAVPYLTAIRMLGRSYAGPMEPLTTHEQELRARLTHDVQVLAGEIGERNFLRSEALAKASGWIDEQMRAAGYAVDKQRFEWDRGTFENLAVERRGATQPDQIVIIGAHYDSALGTPGANDNASGVASMLALARAFASRPVARTLRFVAFVNEEPPYYYTDGMGSVRYARRCRDHNENVVAMISLETMGCFSDEPNSQSYPAPGLEIAYPTTGNFIAFVGNLGSRRLVREVVGRFRQHARFPSEGAALPGWIPGVGWSDHWSFWKAGYPGVMVTDTAPFRYRHYHQAEDTPDKVDTERLARVVAGLEAVVAGLVSDDSR